jgi:threonine aldolase
VRPGRLPAVRDAKEFIQRAHHVRKQLGGGMRQAGVLAAAGIIALEKMSTRLNEDHENARVLVEKLALIDGLHLDPDSPKTNMVYASLDPKVRLDTRQVSESLKEQGVLVGVVGARRFRLVTHYWITDEAVDRAAQAFARILEPQKAVH